jgi:hypothetical protein
VNNVAKGTPRYTPRRPGLNVWKCVYKDPSLACELCQKRNCNVPCTKLPGPKTAKALTPITRQIPTADTDQISSDDVLLLQSLFVDDGHTPMLHCLALQFAMVYGQSIRCETLREALLSYAAAIKCSDASGRHASKACRGLIRKLPAPETLEDTDVFAASILSGAFAFQNCPQSVIIHARGVISMLTELGKDGRAPSSMITLLGPLAYTDAAQCLIWASQRQPGCTFEEATLSTITFEQRVVYHRQLLRFRGLTIMRCSETVQAIAGLFWDTQRTLLDLLLASSRRGLRGLEERTSAVQQLWSCYNDPYLQQSICAIMWPRQLQTRSFEEEVKTYLSHQLLCIRVLKLVLTAPTILQGFSSPEAEEIAIHQLSRGASHQLRPAGEAFDHFTWAFVLNLGIIGLVYSPARTLEGIHQRLDIN